MKRLSPATRIVPAALVLGVIIPYVSYKLRYVDSCMPEEAGMFYVPILVPIVELCSRSIIGELGLFTIGLPAFLSGLAMIALSNGTVMATTSDLFCVPPLLMSFLVYAFLSRIIRWLLTR